MDHTLDQLRRLFRLGADDLSRGAALVLTALSALAVLSFVMAGVVGALERTGAPAPAAHGAAHPGK